MKKTILVIDDDPQINQMLQEILTRAGYEVLHAYSGTEALLLLERQRPDLVLLDLMLPGLSGEEVLPKLQGIPAIVVSAKVDVEDKVKLLLGGAADYMTKPFSVNELLARITVALRKGDATSVRVLTYRDLTLDLASCTLTSGDRQAALTKTEFAILKLLLQNPGQVIPKSTILDRISLDTPDCTERSLRQHISNLRKKLRDAGSTVDVDAVWGIGFKLN